MIAQYKLLAVDMDGTLLNSQSEITENTKAALLSAIDAGVIFVISTGRPMCGVEDVNALFPKDLPFIIFNGAMALMGKSRRVLFSKPLGFEYAKEIYNIGVSRDIPVVLWTNGELFVSRNCEAVKNYQKISGVTPRIIDDINAFEGVDVCKMIWIDAPENAAMYQAEMSAYFGGNVNAHTSRPYLLEFVDAGASKALAMEAIGKAYGIDKNEMVAVGDGYNDISMLEYAGLGVAMGNAPDDIKQLCQYVTSSNDDDGIADVIYKYFLGDSVNDSKITGTPVQFDKYQ